MSEELDIDGVDEPDEIDEGPENAADPIKVQRREKKLQRQARERDEFWIKIFASPVGRREMWAILSEGHCFEDRFACGPNGFPQAEATWFHAGQQALAQRLYQSWQLRDYEGVYRMLCENDPRFSKAKRPPTQGER